MDCHSKINPNYHSVSDITRDDDRDTISVTKEPGVNNEVPQKKGEPNPSARWKTYPVIPAILLCLLGFIVVSIIGIVRRLRQYYLYITRMLCTRMLKKCRGSIVDSNSQYIVREGSRYILHHEAVEKCIEVVYKEQESRRRPKRIRMESPF